MRKEISIMVNGLEEQVPEGASISQLIDLFEETDRHMIVEKNGRYVYPRDYGSVTVTEGDRIEFINPDFGG
ncbi:MAG: MoaD/ThiS family protein [Deltaproteobacteria bacterium]|nr:MoaD/ThiS family protein [Deltaproteobacteria bacterium]